MLLTSLLRYLSYITQAYLPRDGTAPSTPLRINDQPREKPQTSRQANLIKAIPQLKVPSSETVVFVKLADSN